jgi:hypothetical protein
LYHRGRYARRLNLNNSNGERTEKQLDTPIFGYKKGRGIVAPTPAYLVLDLLNR